METLIKKLIKKIEIFVFKRKCVSCGKKDDIFCLKCQVKYFSKKEQGNEDIIEVYDYKNKAIRKAIYGFKYKNNLLFTNIFAQNIYEKMLEEIAEKKIFRDEKIILVPIPISKKRLKQRGYNQTLLIAKEIEKIDNSKNLNLCDILIKKIETKPQVKTINKAERLKNIKNSFDFKKDLSEAIYKKTVFLIDDISTTGATMNEARRVIKKLKPKEIIGFVIAR